MPARNDAEGGGFALHGQVDDTIADANGQSVVELDDVGVDAPVIDANVEAATGHGGDIDGDFGVPRG